MSINAVIADTSKPPPDGMLRIRVRGAVPTRVDARPDKDCRRCNGRGKNTAIIDAEATTIICDCVKNRAARFAQRTEDAAQHVAVAPEAQGAVRRDALNTRAEQLNRLDERIAALTADYTASMAPVEEKIAAAATVLSEAEARVQGVHARWADLQDEARGARERANQLRREAFDEDRRADARERDAARELREIMPVEMTKAKAAQTALADVEKTRSRIALRYAQKLAALRAARSKLADKIARTPR